jgi:hypothetical protein
MKNYLFIFTVIIGFFVVDSAVAKSKNSQAGQYNVTCTVTDHNNGDAEIGDITNPFVFDTDKNGTFISKPLTPKGATNEFEHYIQLNYDKKNELIYLSLTNTAIGVVAQTVKTSDQMYVHLKTKTPDVSIYASCNFSQLTEKK